MTPLLLVAQLAIADGPPPPPQDPPPSAPVTYRVADAMADHAFWVGIASAWDLGTTGFALSRCPSCYESNPLGFNSESRIALKIAADTVTLGTLWKLEKDGHTKAAKIIRWSAVVVQGAFGVNNLIHGIRRK